METRQGVWWFCVKSSDWVVLERLNDEIYYQWQCKQNIMILLIIHLMKYIMETFSWTEIWLIYVKAVSSWSIKNKISHNPVFFYCYMILIRYLSRGISKACNAPVQKCSSLLHRLNYTLDIIQISRTLCIREAEQWWNVLSRNMMIITILIYIFSIGIAVHCRMPIVIQTKCHLLTKYASYISAFD